MPHTYIRISDLGREKEGKKIQSLTNKGVSSFIPSFIAFVKATENVDYIADGSQITKETFNEHLLSFLRSSNGKIHTNSTKF